MAKSKGFCFRIINCAGGDSISNCKIFPQGKFLSEKCWLNFRKRSTEPRVPSSTVALELESTEYNNDSMNAMASSFNLTINAVASEKTSIYKSSSNETSPVGVNSQISTVVVPQKHGNTAENIQDSVAVIIQIAIRRHLGAIKLRKVKYVIKLQAAVRGYLVRVKAVVTLRCIRAIIKMQAISRARLAGQVQAKIAYKVDNKHERSGDDLIFMGEGVYCEGSKSFYSTKKLLSNRFAQQLLASTLKTRPIRIRCDPSKSDSVWKWLERWKTVIPSNTTEENDQYLNHACNENLESPKLFGNNDKNNGFLESKSDLYESSSVSERKVDLNAASESTPQFRSASCYSDSCISTAESGRQGSCTSHRHHHINIIEASKQSETSPLQTDDHISLINESKSDNFNNSTRRNRSGPSDIDAQNVSILFRKPTNSALATAQSKFEALSSNFKNTKCITSSFSTNFHLSKLKKSKEYGLTESLPSQNPIVHIAASECGTEISISSTLDSPDRSETECGEIIFEIGPIDKHTYASNSNKPIDLTPLSRDPAALKIHNYIETTDRSCISPPSIETLGSQNKDGSTPGKKQSPTGSERKLIIKAANDSVEKQSNGNLSSDSKYEKNRKSNGFARNDVEDEPRISINSSSSLPSYMQATKSARAKVHASNSPKLSFELHDKDRHVKKRHSFHVNNDKKDLSPPKQWPAQSVHQHPKSNGIYVSHASAERRWH